MVQEATMILVDDSDFMRNGDYKPTRAQTQIDAANMICQAKRHAHPENTMGLLALRKPDLLLTLTTDVSKIMNKMYCVHPHDSAKLMWENGRECQEEGEAKPLIQFVTALRIAHLVLRHRLSKQQKMRIVVFVGSMVWEDDRDLIRLGRRLKKEKVAVDVISFGDVEANQNKLDIFVKSVNGVGREGCSVSHLLCVPPGSPLSVVLMRSDIVVGEDGNAMPMTIGANGSVEFGDPNDDPELLMALRVSMEEQRIRQEQERGANAGTGSLATVPETTMLGDGTESTPGASSMLEQAIRMSHEQDGGQAITEVPNPLLLAPNVAVTDDMTEDDMLAYALALSLAESQQAQEMEQETVAEDSTVKMEVDEATTQDSSAQEVVKEKEDEEKLEKE